MVLILKGQSCYTNLENMPKISVFINFPGTGELDFTFHTTGP